MTMTEYTVKSNCCEWDVNYLSEPVNNTQTALCKYCKEWCTVIYEYNGEIHETLGQVVD